MVIMEKSKTIALQSATCTDVYKNSLLLFCFSLRISLVLNSAKKNNHDVKETKKFHFTLCRKEFFDTDLSNSQF